MLGALFRPGGSRMELFETDETDVMPVHDFLIPFPKLDSKGVRIVIKWLAVSFFIGRVEDEGEGEMRPGTEKG